MLQNTNLETEISPSKSEFIHQLCYLHHHPISSATKFKGVEFNNWKNNHKLWMWGACLIYNKSVLPLVSLEHKLEQLVWPKEKAT